MIYAFYNTIDGITAWLIGVVMANRKISASKKAAIPKAVQAMNYGADLLIYPEGTWNISQNVLVLDLWPGIYRIACETGAKIVPIVHYLCPGASGDLAHGFQQIDIKNLLHSSAYLLIFALRRRFFADNRLCRQPGPDG